MLRLLAPTLRRTLRADRAPSRLLASAASTSGLKEAFAAKLPSVLADVKHLRTAYADEQIGACTVAQAYGGMRGVTAMTYETSHLDPEDGIRFQGLSIPECQRLLPTATGGEQPLPESLFWLLLAGDVPTDKQIDALRADLAARAKLPQSVLDAVDALPVDMHPMTQLSIGILAMQQQSVMADQHAKGTHKSLYWEHCFEDTMTVIAQLPEVAARIYRRSFRDGSFIPSDADNLDMAANYTRMMGFDDPGFDELMRLFLVLHADHEGGNVSAHTIRITGSALCDPFRALTAGIIGLSGPLHGNANQDALHWILGLKERLGGKEATKENITELCWETLNSGQVIPGFGHAVLRKPDPRYTSLREFSLKHLPDDDMFQMVSYLNEIVPAVLTKQGKVKNPHPNVDFHSGILLRHYGLTEGAYYTVPFGVSRAIGPLANLIWDRALGLPIERPKSVTTAWIKSRFESKATATA